MADPSETSDAADAAGPTGVRWATHAGPDFLALQLSTGAADGRHGPRDALRALVQMRGFTLLTESEELTLPAARGCSLTRTGPTSAELLVRVSARVGATSVPLIELDPAWLSAAVAAGQTAVLLTASAVAPDGTTSEEALRRDVVAGDVLAALVPTADVPD